MNIQMDDQINRQIDRQIIFVQKIFRILSSSQPRTINPQKETKKCHKIKQNNEWRRDTGTSRVRNPKKLPYIYLQSIQQFLPHQSCYGIILACRTRPVDKVNFCAGLADTGFVSYFSMKMSLLPSYAFIMWMIGSVISKGGVMYCNK